MEEVYARELAADGASFSLVDLPGALANAWAQVRRLSAADRYGGVRGEPEFWRAFLNRVRGDLDGGVVSESAFGRLASHFRDPGSWRIYPDVAPTLGRLQEAGLRLAVVSNWDSQLPALLAALELAPQFHAVLVSAIEETGKPEPEIFRRACRRLAVETAQALHVGDSLREDYEGARDAGLAALLLDRDSRHESVPDRIQSLTEVVVRLGV